MKLRDFLVVLRTRWLIVLGVTVFVTGIATAYTFQETPVYTAKARFFLAAKADSPQAKQSGPYVVSPDDLNTYVEILGSPAVMDPLRESLDLPPGTPISASVAPTGETSLLEVTAHSSNAQQAADVANAVGPALASVAPTFSVLLRASGQTVEATTVTPASVPASPTSPVFSRNVTLGVLAGLLLGIGIAFVRHTLDTKVRTDLDIRSFSTRPMLGELPIDRGKTSQVTLDRDPHGGYAEAIRRLRTNLQFVDVTTGRHSFVVTSATPSEGKTTTTVNLAIAMATTGMKVLLIDGDLRNPSVAKSLGLEGGAGLTTVLLGSAEVADVIQRWRDSTLFVLAAGQIPPNPSELLGSEPMRELFGKLQHDFDFILVDSPPVVPVVDAVLLDQLTGGTLMVVASNRTKKRDLSSAVKQLTTIEAKLAGFALNFVPINESDPYRHGYYRYQEEQKAAANKTKPGLIKGRAKARGRRVASKPKP